MALNIKQTKFCEEYVIDLNATQAAIRAGYSEKTAYSIGQRLLKEVEAAAYIQTLQDEIKERNKLKADDVVQDILEVKARCMQKKPVMVFDKVEKEYVQKEEYVVDEETGEEKLLGVWQFDSQGALKALDMLGKHIGIYEKNNGQKAASNNVVINNNIVDRVLEKIKDI